VHLEKVTTRSSEAGVIGWIASNDVTLFTVVLVLVIAAFLQARVASGTRRQQDLSTEKAALNATLADTDDQLASARSLLDKTINSLKLTQAERDALQAQLVEKLASLAELNSKLKGLLSEKSALEVERQSLANARDALLREKAGLVSAGDELSTANRSLSERLEALAADLESKVAALAEIEAQRDRLEMHSDELGSIVASLKQRLREMHIDLVAARDDAVAVRAAAEKNDRELAAKVAAADAHAEDYLQQLRAATTLLQSLEGEKEKLKVELSDAERKRQVELLAEAENNKHLVGLAGPMKRVAILFDASGSMRQAGAQGADRWAEAQSIAATWLRHLNVQQCLLIVYGSDVRTFPEDGTLADLRGADGAARREELLDQVRLIAPAGRTNTLAALQKAYEYDVDTILLLSDGAPSRASTGKYDAALAQEIYQLCESHAGIPVNTIGLGNYFDQEMSTFLRTVASITGGGFRGQ
jgi:septal ring factor EnvC (AmiA/AmiB activator)